MVNNGHIRVNNGHIRRLSKKSRHLTFLDKVKIPNLSLHIYRILIGRIRDIFADDNETSHRHHLIDYKKGIELIVRCNVTYCYG